MAGAPFSSAEEVWQWVRAAGHLADRAIDDHAAELAAAGSGAAVEQVRRRRRAECDDAGERLRLVLDGQWWETADAVVISGAWAMARTWAAHNDPLAVRAAERIQAELRQRYGIEVQLPSRTDAPYE